MLHAQGGPDASISLDSRGERTGTNPQTLSPCACSRSGSWRPEPTYGSWLTIRRPLTCSSPTSLSQRLAGLVEKPPLLAPRACRGLDVHRFDGLRVLRVTCPSSAGRGSISSQGCLSCRPFAM